MLEIDCFSFSFTDIQTGAINTTAANIIITDNNFKQLQTNAFAITKWNTINFENNHVVQLQSFFDFSEIFPNLINEFTFKGNEIYNISSYALSFLPKIPEQINHFKFDDNLFNITCICEIDKWIESLLQSNEADHVNSRNIDYIINTSFCSVTPLLERCFEIEEGNINMKNFTKLLCNMNEDTIKCMKYNGEVKVIETTEIMFLDEIDTQQSHPTIVIVGFVFLGILILTAVGSIVIALIRGGLWLKRKGYCNHFRNFHYNRNVSSLEDEGVIVNEDSNNKSESDKNDAPLQLTQELLQSLREQLENPETHEQAREMIEKLYDMFIIPEEGYTNNNRQEDPHLYEELGNLQLPQLNNETEPLQQNNAVNFLKFMEEKMYPEKEIPLTLYSEPKDTTVHLYSELQQKINGETAEEETENKSSLKSIDSKKMAIRPLPEKPDFNKPGPSSKQ